jgi:glc operon protein GlcG
MTILERSFVVAIAMLGLDLLPAGPAVAQGTPPAAPAPSIAYAPPSISLAEARAIIEGATAFAREANLRMAVVVVDQAGNVVSADRMDGAALQNIRFAEGKAFASALYRQTTEAMGALYKTRPDRYFGIINMYPGKIYLVGGGVPLALDGRLVGAVGVAGLPEGVDEKAGRAGIAAWMKLRENKK